MTEPDGFNDSPPVLLPAEELEFESDNYLRSTIAEDLDLDAS